MSYSYTGFENPSRGTAAAFGNPNVNFQSQMMMHGGPAAPYETVLHPQPHRGSFGPNSFSPSSTRRPGAPTMRPSHGSSDSSTFQTSSQSSEEGWDLNSRSRTPSDQDLDLASSSGVPDAKLSQRQLLIREIVRTERSYVRDLGLVIHVPSAFCPHQDPLARFPLCLFNYPQLSSFVTPCPPRSLILNWKHVIGN